MHTFRPGLVSVTFRGLSRERIVELAADARLVAIEWGGDVHVPHGDLAAAREARRRCADAGIAINAYGSYYRAAAEATKSPSFEAVLSSSLELGAPTIRVWAGTCASADADGDLRRRIVDDLSHISTIAAAHNLHVALEYHGGTLTDTLESTRSVLEAIGAPNLRSYWQPRSRGEGAEQNIAEIRALSPYLGDVHVFHWIDRVRCPLADGADAWAAYLSAAAEDGVERFASLEFVRDDDPAALLEDARALHAILDRVNGSHHVGDSNRAER